MRTTPAVAVLAVSLVFAPLALAQDGADEAPDISGTYRFVERELADGTVLSKGMAGLLTFTDEYRNFNLYWIDRLGNRASISIVSTYELTAKEYAETNIYTVRTDEAVKERLDYELEPRTGTSDVTIENGVVSFDLPLRDEPRLVIDGEGLTATLEDVFVDRWEKID